MVDWLSLAVPLAYLGVLIGSLATFSSLYRKRKAQKAASLESWFPAHIQRDIYFSLMHLDPPAEKKSPAVPESVLKASLLRRATEDIRRVMTLRSQKQALGVLLQRGSVGDDLWQRFLRAEKEMEDEVRDVVSEANAYVPGWGQVIFQSANEMLNNDLYRARLKEHSEKAAEERAWWDKKKSSIQEEFMKELNEESAVPNAKIADVSGSNSPIAPASVSASRPVTPAKQNLAASVANTPSVQGSDDDAVMVEADTSTVNSPGTPGSVSAKKKNKGKGKK
ncbi:Uncharacterized protein PECH_006759 [Penicillium ucsense]|uniref:Translocation protein n=1 Tax=Penicillium ucsense TaxID=2839758 RepID=A0A8J8W2K0_9EURO|nr:Uncharacterized protein PECM_000462 [Penicillium ucsense]KAF7735346.1 Uncharacterized protein PECH_006759 [Penicillium ucsense]